MNASFPAGWALMKPQQTIEPAEFNRLWRRGGLKATRKRDGNRAHIVTAGDATRIYSRNGTLDWTDKLAHIARHWAAAPAGYLVDIEAHTLEEGTNSFQNAMNTNPELVHWSAFDLLKLDGTMTAQSWRRRRQMLGSMEQVIGPGSHWGGGIFFDLSPNADYDEVLACIAREKCEGVVIWDEEAPHVLNTNGNTKRGRSWKIKPRMTEDLLVTAVNAPKDASLGLGCASLKVSRRHEDGTLQPIKAPLGSFDVGFDRHAALRIGTPFVVEVSHYGEDDNGNLVFPKVLRTRFDLHPDFGIGNFMGLAA